MARKFLTSIDLNKNEIQNAVVQNLGSAPGSPVEGQIYWDTVAHKLMTRDNSAFRTQAALEVANTFTATQTFNAAINGNNVIALTGAGASSVAGTFQGTQFIATGQTGAATSTKYAGGNASGSPASGTYVTGDWTVTTGGDIYVCSSGGTPGTWVRVGSYLLGATNSWTAANTFTGGVAVNTVGITGNKEINLTGTSTSSVAGTFTGTALIASGLTGSTAASRYVGATASGAPASGAHLVGDFSVDQTGSIWVCTVAATPGTFVQLAAASYGSVVAQTSFGAASANGSNTTSSRSDHTHGTPTHVHADHNAIVLNDLATATAGYSMGGFALTNVLAPSAGTDAANKTYVDGVAQGLDFKPSVRVVASANGTLASAYANGQVVDGITLATGDRILLAAQTTVTENGIYVVAASGAPTRATDADASGEISPGALVYIEVGTAWAGSQWICTATAATPWVPGTNGSTWTQFSGANTTAAGAGLTATGQIWAVGAGTGIVVGADTVGVSTVDDNTRVVRKWSATIGDNSTTSIVVTHNLNTRDVTVAVYLNASTWDEVMCDVQHTSVNTCTLIFTVAPTTNQYVAVVHG